MTAVTWLPAACQGRARVRDRCTMGVKGLLELLRRRYAAFVDASTERVRESHLLCVDLISQFYRLQHGGANAARISGDDAYRAVTRELFAWLVTPLYDAQGAQMTRRAVVVTDKSAWVPAQKAREQRARRDAQDKAAERARAAGTYQDFAAGVRFTDEGVIRSEPVYDVEVAVPFDVFSALHQSHARVALISYVRVRLMNAPLPVNAELLVDMDNDSPILRARPHATDAACPVPWATIGHGACDGRVVDDTALHIAEDGTVACRVARPAALGEGEVLALVYLATHLTAAGRAATPAQSVCIWSQDGDTLAIAARLLWRYAGAGARVVWRTNPAETIDLTGLLAHLRDGDAAVASPDCVVAALVSLGTDYFAKSALFNQIGADALWDAALAFRLPRGTHARAPLPRDAVPFEHIADAYVYLAYAHASRAFADGNTPAARALRAEMRAAFDATAAVPRALAERLFDGFRQRRIALPDEAQLATGCAEFAWNVAYWRSVAPYAARLE